MPDILDRIPDPHDVRVRLSHTLREADFLRRLAKLAERWQAEQARRACTINRDAQQEVSP